MGLSPCTVAGVSVLGLDAYGRAFVYMQSRARLNVEPEVSLVSAKQEELLSLASELRVLSKHENLCQTRGTKAVKKQLKQVIQTLHDLNSNPLHLFNVSTNDSFLTGEYPLLNRAPDFKPGRTHSLTDSASPISLRESSTNDIMFPSLELFSQKDLDDVSASGLTPFLDPKDMEIDWPGTDMTGFGDIGPAIARDFSGYEFPEIVNGSLDTEAGGNALPGDYGNRGRGGRFDDSAFRS